MLLSCIPSSMNAHNVHVHHKIQTPRVTDRALKIRPTLPFQPQLYPSPNLHFSLQLHRTTYGVPLRAKWNHSFLPLPTLSHCLHQCSSSSNVLVAHLGAWLHRRVWFGRSAVRSDILHFSQAPSCCWRYWCWWFSGPTLSSTDPEAPSPLLLLGKSF